MTSFLLSLLVSAIGAAEGNGATNAIPIKLPVYQDWWTPKSKLGDQWVVPLKKPGDVVWYTFDLEDDLVILATHYGRKGNKATVEILDKSLKRIAPSEDMENERLVCNEKLKMGTYFIKVTSIATNGEPFKIELCKVSKSNTDAASTPPHANSQFTNFSPNQLVGQWRRNDLARKVTTNITFNRDGTYLATVESPGQDKVSMSGKWNLKGDVVNYEITSSSNTNIPSGATDRDRLIEISTNRFVNQFTIESASDIETYVRIK